MIDVYHYGNFESLDKVLSDQYWGVPVEMKMELDHPRDHFRLEPRTEYPDLTQRMLGYIAGRGTSEPSLPKGLEFDMESEPQLIFTKSGRLLVFDWSRRRRYPKEIVEEMEVAKDTYNPFLGAVSLALADSLIAMSSAEMLASNVQNLAKARVRDGRATLTYAFKTAVEVDDEVVLYQRNVSAGVIQPIGKSKFCVGLDLVYRPTTKETILCSGNRLAIGMVQPRSFTVGQTYEDGDKDTIQSLARFDKVQLV